MLPLSPLTIELKVHVVGREESPGTPAIQEPPVAETETMLVPAGRISSIKTFTPVDGPLLLTSSV